MYSLARNLLFRLNPETAHDLSMSSMRVGHKLGMMGLFGVQVPSRPVEVMGLSFPHPVGLAAGLDKNAECVDALGALGFGFIEVGTVTPRAQPGNPKPRLFRLVEQQAIINRMGFNNLGVDHLVEAIQKVAFKRVIGINIGKNRDTPMEESENDYLTCLRKVYPHAGYVAVNLSCPNIPGLSKLQFGDTLDTLLAALKAEQAKLAEEHGRYVPLAIKISPDMDEADIRQIARTFMRFEIDGVIATNTTTTRDGVEDSEHAQEQGGLSGRPLNQRSTETIRILADELKGALPIIAVGGIFTGADAAEKIKAGASLVQLYSGFIYRGPELILEAADAIASVTANQTA